ncbi:hypothetical protein LCGC14_3079200, partial [marine sediment metagenome]
MPEPNLEPFPNHRQTQGVHLLISNNWGRDFHPLIYRTSQEVVYTPLTL